VVWITGASSGLGANLAIHFAKSGAQVILTARRVDKLQEVARKCMGVSALSPVLLPFDVTNYTAQQEAYDHIVSTFSRIDILILNAGVSQRAQAVDFPFDKTRELMELNFFSVVHLSQLVLPHMIQRKSGHVSKYDQMMSATELS
jgi:short-subunit dehydrogenase